MSIGELTRSVPFVLALFAVTALGLPFGLEQIGETSGLFKFPATKTVRGWFSPSSPQDSGGGSKSVDWTSYRKALEDFAKWADGQNEVVVSHPKLDRVVFEVPPERKTQRRLWPVPVTSCAPAGSEANPDRKTGNAGYIFVSGFDRLFREGRDRIEPTRDRCGYEILSVGARTVWFRAIFETVGDVPRGHVRLPEFTRMEGGSLVRGNRKYVARDAFPLATGGWLMIDSFLPPDGTVFKVIDENHRELMTLLCVVIGEKGGR